MNLALREVYKKAFGYKATGYENTNIKAIVMPLEGYALKLPEEPQLGAFKYNLWGVPFFMPTQIGDYMLPNEPIITVTGGKKIVEQEIDSMDGTVKMEFSMKDKEVVIEGVIDKEAESDEYPEAEMRKIRAIIEHRGHLPIVNKIANLLGIYYVVLYEFDFPGVPGEPGMQAYKLTFKSDEPQKLVLNENGQ